MESADMQRLTLEVRDRLDITELVSGLGLYTDLRDWERVKSYFAPLVTTDYTSLFGGEVTSSSPHDLVAGWRTLLPGFDATQHLIGNIVIADVSSRAIARSHVRATHWLGHEHWTVGGLYTHRLVQTAEGWRVAAVAIQRLYEEGDRALLQAASARVVEREHTDSKKQ